MWTLFKRECEDVWMYLIAAILVVGGPIVWTEFVLNLDKHSEPSGYVIPEFLLGYAMLCILLLVVGANRMVFDRTNGISAFYAGHLTTRSQVFIMRLLLGAMFVVLFYIPLGYWFVHRIFQESCTSSEKALALNGQRVGTMIFLSLFLLTCYNIGLRMGLYKKRFAYILGTACLGVILLLFVILKGLGFEATFILLVLNAAMVYSAWCDYSATAL